MSTSKTTMFSVEVSCSFFYCIINRLRSTYEYRHFPPEIKHKCYLVLQLVCNSSAQVGTKIFFLKGIRLTISYVAGLSARELHSIVLRIRVVIQNYCCRRKFCCNCKQSIQLCCWFSINNYYYKNDVQSACPFFVIELSKNTGWV